MARKSKNKSNKYSSGRGFITTANRFNSRLPIKFQPYTQNLVKLGIAQSNSVDDRLFSPRRLRPFKKPMTIFGHPAPVKTVFKKGKKLHVQPYFVIPEVTAVCVRRKTRKEVLFAKGRAGRSGGQRRPRRNSSSSISCR